MDKLTELQMKLKDMPCPRCYHTKLEASLQPGHAGDSPSYIAQCGNCGHRFAIDGDRPSWESLEEKTRRAVKKQGCPRCGSPRLELNFRCTLESHQCFHIATCQKCGAVFVVEQPEPGERNPSILDM